MTGANNIIIKKIFPCANWSRDQICKLKIDFEALAYITIPCDAIKINKIILNHVSVKSTVTDLMAGAGGNTIAFAREFYKVYSIEKNDRRFNYLVNNIHAYAHVIKNDVVYYNGDCFNVVGEITDHNVIFVDPPWGGKKYKTQKYLRIMLSHDGKNIDLEDACIKLMDKTFMKKIPELIVIKLPVNYDLKYMYKKISKHTSHIYIYELVRMVIIVIQL